MSSINGRLPCGRQASPPTLLLPPPPLPCDRDDPTILAWGLANEPRCAGDTCCAAIPRWAHETAVFLKGLDANHLVCLDTEGFLGPSTPADAASANPYCCAGSGCDFAAEAASPALDLSCAHLYPDLWLPSASEEVGALSRAGARAAAQVLALACTEPCTARHAPAGAPALLAGLAGLPRGPGPPPGQAPGALRVRQAAAGGGGRGCGAARGRHWQPPRALVSAGALGRGCSWARTSWGSGAHPISTRMPLSHRLPTHCAAHPPP